MNKITYHLLLARNSIIYNLFEEVRSKLYLSNLKKTKNLHIAIEDSTVRGGLKKFSKAGWLKTFFRKVFVSKHKYYDNHALIIEFSIPTVKNKKSEYYQYIVLGMICYFDDINEDTGEYKLFTVNTYSFNEDIFNTNISRWDAKDKKYYTEQTRQHTKSDKKSLDSKNFKLKFPVGEDINPRDKKTVINFINKIVLKTFQNKIKKVK